MSEKKKQDSSSEASTSRGAKAARGLKKMLSRVPKALGIWAQKPQEGFGEP